MTNQENLKNPAVEEKRVMIEVTNTRDAFMVVATRILDPKQTGKIPFYNMRQLDDAQTAERNKLIQIKTEITDEIIEALGGVVEEPEEPEVPTEPEGPTEEVPEEPEVPTEEVPEEPEVPTEEEETPPEVEEGEDEEETEAEKESVTPSATEIDGMTMKDIKEYITENDIDVPGYNSMNAGELKSAFKKALGYEVEEEEELE